MDSWSAFNKRVQIGNSYDFGHFDLCVNIQHESDGETIKGKFCMVQYFSKSNRTLPHGPRRSRYNFGWKNSDRRLGGAVCIPEACPAEVSRQLVKKLMIASDLDVAEDYDQMKYCKPSIASRSTSQILFGFYTFLLILLSVTSSATIYDYKFKMSNKWLEAFSLYTNGRNFLDINKTAEALPSLYCIRFLGAVSVTFFHAFYFRFSFPAFDSTQTLKFNNSIFGALVHLNVVSVEAFFVMSGLVITKSMIKSMRR
jgi:hypothetical protein